MKFFSLLAYKSSILGGSEHPSLCPFYQSPIAITFIKFRAVQLGHHVLTPRSLMNCLKPWYLGYTAMILHDHTNLPNPTDISLEKQNPYSLWNGISTDPGATTKLMR
jgi:hypothetical protein